MCVCVEVIDKTRVFINSNFHNKTHCYSFIIGCIKHDAACVGEMKSCLFTITFICSAHAYVYINILL